MCIRLKGKKKSVSSLVLARHVASCFLKHKGEEVLLSDMRALSGRGHGFDFFVIASGSSHAHVQSLCEHTLREVREKTNEGPHFCEGMTAARWVILDYVDVVAHVFHKEVRRYYELESLWSDAKWLALEAQDLMHASSPVSKK